ncbi:hypothetical protein MMC25_008114 [Agyrium rufum]|nr:hypothetical protein [Agyrium rufum]
MSTPSSSGDSDDNPFITFKKYADEQLATLLQNLIGLPSASTRHTQVSDEDFWKDLANETRKIAREHTKDIADEADQSRREPRSPLRLNMTLGEPMFDFAMRNPFKINLYEQWYDAAENQARRKKIAERMENSRKQNTPSSDLDQWNGIRCPYRPTEHDTPKISASSDQPQQSSNLRTLFSENSFSSYSSSLGAFDLENLPPNAWPVAYVALSPYSPLQVEKELNRDGPDAKWRHAFEDLLRLNEGRGIESQVLRKRYGDAQKDPLAWISEMLGTGIFGPWHQLPVIRWKDHSQWNTCRMRMRHANYRDEVWTADVAQMNQNKLEANCEESQGPEGHKEEDNDDEMTELDLYEHFLDNQDKPSSSPNSGSKPVSVGSDDIKSSIMSAQTKEVAPQASNTKSQSILSTLTTTEREVLPDGTMRTKVVLKKRFADGREVSSEAVETTHPQGSQKSGPSTQAGSTENPFNDYHMQLLRSQQQELEKQRKRTEQQEQEEQQKQQQNGKKGWFWS